MMISRDKLLSSHRSQVKSSLWGKLNVFNSYLFFSGIDFIVLGYHWFLYFNPRNFYSYNTFLYELIFNTSITLASLICLIPYSYLFYVATVMYLLRFWHICHIAGRVVGLIMFNMARLLFGGRVKLWFKYCKSSQLIGSCIPTGILRLLLVLISLWYCLVLQKIRSFGGTGKEFKSAEELESEVIAEAESGGPENGNKVIDII